MPSWFQADNFHCEQLVESWKLVPHIPQRLTSLKLFRTIPSMRSTVAMEYQDGVVALVQSQPRGSHQAQRVETGKRHVVPVSIPHFPQKFSVLADELPDIRAFGTVDGMTTVNSVIAEKLANAYSNFAITNENLQLGALRGIIKDADGSTILDLFDLFGLTQDAVNMDLGATPDNIETKCNTIIRTMAENGGGTPITGVHGFCGNAYFDALVATSEVRAAYDRQNDGAFLRDGHVYGKVLYKNVLFENYRGDYGASSLIDDDEAIFFPMGADIYRVYNGPADTMSSVGRSGRDIEITREMLPHDAGVEYKLQQNRIHFVKRPKMLISSTATYAA